MNSLSLRIIQLLTVGYMLFSICFLLFVLSTDTSINDIRIGYQESVRFTYFFLGEDALEPDLDNVSTPNRSNATILYSESAVIKVLASLSCLGSIVVSFFLFRLVTFIRRNGVFHDHVYSYLNTIAATFISLMIFRGLIVPIVIGSCTGQSQSITLTMDGQTILWILLLVFMGTVLREGVKLKTENDLTI